MQDRFKKLIANEFSNCVRNTINRMSINEPTYRPFHTALLSEDVIYWSRFERSFSTSFGQRVIEEIAKIVALSNGASEVQRQKTTIVNIDEAYDEAITSHIKELRQNIETRRDWNTSLNRIQKTPIVGSNREIRIISDLWWKKDNTENFISLKTVKPNIDQTAVAKEDCLRLKIAFPQCNVYFGLPYNPYGNEKNSYYHSPPMRIFDFHRDPVVLIGKELWDTIGGRGCYEELLDIARQVGQETREQITLLRNNQ